MPHKFDELAHEWLSHGPSVFAIVRRYGDLESRETWSFDITTLDVGGLQQIQDEQATAAFALRKMQALNAILAHRPAGWIAADLEGVAAPLIAEILHQLERTRDSAEAQVGDQSKVDVARLKDAQHLLGRMLAQIALNRGLQLDPN